MLKIKRISHILNIYKSTLKVDKIKNFNKNNR